jgi:FKBP-type peptidyl-prolyl cis-trans isomerase 2
MKHLIIFTCYIAFLSSCIKFEESAFQKETELQNRLLADHIAVNKINATSHPVGFYFEKIQDNPLGNRISSNDTIGVYYEIKTIKGTMVESYMDETKSPRLFVHKESALVPKGLNFASALAKEGEVFKVFLPSYLAFESYAFPQLFQGNEQFEILVKFAKIFNRDEIKTMEDLTAQEYLQKNSLEGFTKQEDGLYLSKKESTLADAVVAKNGDVITFNFTLNQLGENIPVLESSTENYQLTLGASNNLKFLNQVMKDVKKGDEIDVIVPSHLAFGSSIQVFPYQVRRDLIRNGLVPLIVRPFEPTRFKAAIIEVKK